MVAVTGGPRLRIGVLISGRGSNLQALIEAADQSDYPAEIVLVISNIAGAYGLERAAAAGLATRVVEHTAYPSREAFERALTETLRASDCHLVCLAGFMRLLTGAFVETWWDRLINIHPSLLPAFRGLHVHEQVLAYGARFSGCTVHFVRPAMDDGPIIVQAVVPVFDDDDPDSLAARVLSEEHRIYPLAVRLIAEARVRVVGARVCVLGAAHDEVSLTNPRG